VEDDELATVELAASALDEEAAVPVLEALGLAVAEGVDTIWEAVSLPHLSWMLVVQFAWAVASPTLALMQLVKVCWQKNCPGNWC
jgi:hypothetical protein